MAVVERRDARPVAITVLAGISGQDKGALTRRIIEGSGRADQIMSIDFDRILMQASGSADIATFLDMP